MPEILETVLLDPSEIAVADRLRAVDEAWVFALAASIEEKGQDTAITVRRNGGGVLHLVAGAHRLEACRRLGIKIRAEVIACSELEARMIEIDENLFRHELGALDRAVFLAERKAVYLELHPETARGVAGGMARQGSAMDIVSFAEETQRRTGITRKTIDRAVKIATQIPADLRARLAGTPTADRQVDLLHIADLPPDQQRQVVALLVGGGAKDLKKAMAIVAGMDGPPPDADDVQVAKLENLWARASSVAKVRFLAILRETGELEG